MIIDLLGRYFLFRQSQNTDKRISACVLACYIHKKNWAKQHGGAIVNIV